jgi:hypothetical protein
LPANKEVIVRLAQQTMDNIEGKYEPTATVSTVGLLVAIDRGGQVTYEYAFPPNTPKHEALGLLRIVEDAIAQQY